LAGMPAFFVARGPLFAIRLTLRRKAGLHPKKLTLHWLTYILCHLGSRIFFPNCRAIAQCCCRLLRWGRPDG
jgi:hypothetical protein